MHDLRAEDSTFFDRAGLIIRVGATVAAPRAVVFGALAEAESWPQWFLTMRTARWTSAKTHCVGAERSVSLDLLGTFDERFIAWDDGRRMAFTVLRASSPLTRAIAEDYRVHDAPGGSTRLEWTMAIEPRGAAFVLAPLTRIALRQIFLRSCKRLERRLATAAVAMACLAAIGCGAAVAPNGDASPDAIGVDGGAGCQLPNGQFCAEGQSCPAGDGCNSCSCHNGLAGCTLLACIDAGPPVDVVQPMDAPTDGVIGCPDRTSIDPSGACVGPSGPVSPLCCRYSCDPLEVVCNQVPPTCSAGNGPSVMSACYGPCVPFGACGCNPVLSRPTCPMGALCGPDSRCHPR